MISDRTAEAIRNYIGERSSVTVPDIDVFLRAFPMVLTPLQLFIGLQLYAKNNPPRTEGYKTHIAGAKALLLCLTSQRSAVSQEVDLLRS